MCRDRHDAPLTPYVISGNVGPRGDGYDPETLMTPVEAEADHGEQIRVFAEAGVDLIGAVTMTHVGEAVGIVRAAQACALSVVAAELRRASPACRPPAVPVFLTIFLRSLRVGGPFRDAGATVPGAVSRSTEPGERR